MNDNVVIDHYSKRARQLTQPVSFGLGDVVELAQLKEGETVVDLGSGPGTEMMRAATVVGSTGRVIGVDGSADMIALASESLKHFTNVEFVPGRLDAIPLPSGTVDVVVSNCVFNLVSDKTQALSEAYRILAPGGRFAILDTALELEPDAEFRNNSEALCGCVAGAPTMAEWETLLAATDFEDVTIEPRKQSCCAEKGVTAFAVAVTASKPS